MRDQVHNISALSAIAAATYAADNTAISIDRQSYDSVTFLLSIGVGGITFTGTNKVEFVMEHSDDASTWTPVGADNVLNATPDVNGIVVSLIAAHAAATVQKIGYVDGTIGEKRYVRLRADFSGTHGTGTPIDAIALLGRSRLKPAA